MIWPICAESAVKPQTTNQPDQTHIGVLDVTCVEKTCIYEIDSIHIY